MIWIESGIAHFAMHWKLNQKKSLFWWQKFVGIPKQTEKSCAKYSLKNTVSLLFISLIKMWWKRANWLSGQNLERRKRIIFTNYSITRDSQRYQRKIMLLYYWFWRWNEERFQGDPKRIWTSRWRNCHFGILKISSEVLFNSVSSQKTLSLHNSILNSILKNDSCFFQRFFSNIILAGGNSMFWGLKERIEIEMQSNLQISTKIRVISSSPGLVVPFFHLYPILIVSLFQVKIIMSMGCNCTLKVYFRKKNLFWMNKMHLFFFIYFS